jgi:hypothetical protein
MQVGAEYHIVKFLHHHSKSELTQITTLLP